MLVTVGVVFAACEGDLLATLHLDQDLIDSLAEVAEFLTSDLILDALELLDSGSIGGGGLHCQLHFPIRPRHLIPGASLQLLFDDPFVPEEVVLGHPADEFNLKDQGRVLRDFWGRTARSVGELWREGEFCHFTPLHRRHANIPAFDDLALPECKDERLSPVPRRVEFAAVREEGPDVVDGDLVAFLRSFPALDFGDDFLLHTLGKVGRVRWEFDLGHALVFIIVVVTHRGHHFLIGIHLGNTN
mmetsp:Transcript_9990/g.21979  ORF Transcript_9990/g.21979 Transcript_9990/m.21979 type:complete len:244 (+) Transcript_9990:1470-2201(+)